MAPARRQAGLLVGIGIAGGLLGWFAFQLGHGAMDQEAPDIEEARFFYVVAVVVGACMLAGLALADRAYGWLVALLGVAVGVPVGLWYGHAMSGYYNGGEFLFETIDGSPTSWIALPLMTASGVAIGVSAIWKGEAVARTTGGVGMMWASIAAVAAIIHLGRLEQEAALAREAYESPPGALVLLAVALLVAAAWRRRA